MQIVVSLVATSTTFFVQNSESISMLKGTCYISDKENFDKVKILIDVE